MVSKNKKGGKTPSNGGGRATQVKQTATGRWVVSSRNGRTQELVTGKSSSKAMDEAVKVYGRALRRLADK
jgi:hypothetical protein